MMKGREDQNSNKEHPEPVELCRVGLQDAHLLAGLLEEAGLDVQVADAASGTGFPTSSTMGESVVYVDKRHLEEARRIEREFQERQLGE
jgi:hypothetical protein